MLPAACLCRLWQRKSIEFLVLHPVLYNSLCSVYCRWDMETVMDVQQVAFRNAQLGPSSAQLETCGRRMTCLPGSRSYACCPKFPASTCQKDLLAQSSSARMRLARSCWPTRDGMARTPRFQKSASPRSSCYLDLSHALRTRSGLADSRSPTHPLS